MARHTKVYNALLSFYVESISDIENSLDIANSRRSTLPNQFNEDSLSALRGSVATELEAIINLARDQSVHFEKIEMIKEWEKSSLIESTAEMCLKSLRRMKNKGIITTHRNIDLGSLMQHVPNL